MLPIISIHIHREAKLIPIDAKTNHRFQVNLQGVIELLSAHLYSGPQVFLRELLQNSVDAIQARIQLDATIEGQIEVELTPSRDGRPSTIIFSDNGVGLTEQEVHRFLSTIGESSKRGPDVIRPQDFLGQFGIGLLSCFMVCDEIVMVTRSARSQNSVSLEWRGACDGKYTIKKLESEIEPGTRVYLTCKPGSDSYFREDRIRELLTHYGRLLPFRIQLATGTRLIGINEKTPPWRRLRSLPREQRECLLEYGSNVFGESFFDAIPIHLPKIGVDGVAYVLSSAPSISARQKHQVFLKNMFLTDSVDNLLPPWAFFVKLIVNVASLTPTASREGLRDNAELVECRDKLGDTLKSYLVNLAKNEPDKMLRFLAIHDLTVKALAVGDDDFYRIVFECIPIETSLGEMTFGEYRKQYDVFKYTATRDQFRQIARVAMAQGLCVINGGYVYITELIEKYPQVFSESSLERIDARQVTAGFITLSEDDEQRAAGFLEMAGDLLRPFRCSVEVKKFSPNDLPALYTTSEDGEFQRSVEQAKLISDPTWTSMLNGLLPKDRNRPFSKLCFNLHNRVVQELIECENRDAIAPSVETLYVQALLLGHHPLNASEMQLLNTGIMNLIRQATQ